MRLLRPQVRAQAGRRRGPPLRCRAAPRSAPARTCTLIDGSGYIFRAYHALPPLTRKSDGLPVGAVAGFCNMLWKLLEDAKGADAPTHLAVIFDKSEKTFRNELYAEYKAHRPPAPEDLVPQFPLIREATARVRRALHRAGRLRGRRPDRHLCLPGRATPGGQVIIVSSDKDLMQLVGARRRRCSTP